ncbi:MAG: CmcI family methyltransferase [Terrimicrobiaceae bacterium]|nr:CmcI family methyltransferase [Terrimicrobiaceae bacterium]
MKPPHTRSVDSISAALMLHPGNHSNVTWRGRPIWRNTFDSWCCQEILHRVRPRWIIETGTHRGGSAAFFADLCTQAGFGEVITTGIENQHGHAQPGGDLRRKS